MKTLFIKRIDGKAILCPFLGFQVENWEDMKSLLKKEFFNREGGYPGLAFSTKKKNIVVLFAGHQFIHGEAGKWAIFNTDTDEYPTEWFKLSEKWDEVSELFMDFAQVKAEAGAIKKIMEITGGVYINI